MKIGLLIIANEILQGKIQDLHLSYFSRLLTKHHQTLSRSIIVADNLSEIQESLSYFKDFDLLVTSGGIGPTEDDLTKKAIANFLEVELINSESSFLLAQNHYHRMGKNFINKNHPYAFLPKGSSALENFTGLAPGIKAIKNKLQIYSLPGVPHEFQAMVEKHILPLFHQQDLFIEDVVFQTAQIPEEKIFTELDPTLWKKLESFGLVSSLPHPLRVDIGVRISEKTKSELEKKKNELIHFIKSHPLNTYLWNIGNSTLEEKIMEILRKKSQTLATAESCTGGLLAHRLTNMPGSSSIYWGSIVSYDNSVKKNLLHVSNDSLLLKGAVSEKVVREMCQGALENLKTTYAIATSGIAGPSGGSTEKPVGTVCIAVGNLKNIQTKTYNFKGSRDSLKFRFSEQAFLDLLHFLEPFS